MIRKTIKWIFKITISVFLICWLFSLARCEILTLQYGRHFSNNAKLADMVGEVDMVKVLNCSEHVAEVYCVSGGKMLGTVSEFVKQEGVWEYFEWTDTAWSNYGGNADDVVWPYWFHYIWQLLY